MRMVVPVLALLVLLWLVFLTPWRGGGKGTRVEVSSRVEESGDTAPKPQAAIRFVGGNDPLILEFGAEDGSLRRDLEILRDVVRDCQLLIKDFDRYHLPGNPEIVRFLQGANPDRLAWLPRDFPFVNEKGELLDRHGTPIFFHRLSGTGFEYCSAGPDGELWTADDVVVK